MKNLAKMLERRLFWILTWRRNSGNHQKLVTLPAKVVQPLMLSSFSLDDYFIHLRFFLREQEMGRQNENITFCLHFRGPR